MAGSTLRRAAGAGAALQDGARSLLPLLTRPRHPALWDSPRNDSGAGPAGDQGKC